MSHSLNVDCFNNNGAVTPPLPSGGSNMNEAIYNGPKVNGYYWYFENNERQVVRYERGLVYFCGMVTPIKAVECAGEFYKVPEPG